MQTSITITAFKPQYREAVIEILQSEKLPVDDLPANLQNFFIATANGLVVGAIGLEVYGRDGFLRSLVVKPEYRKMKIAEELIKEIEQLGKVLGLENIYLLTETAQGYFINRGYNLIEREYAPALLQQSSEFAHACPASATLMKKSI
jgi:amino-acid N-acetyltransferase